MNLHSFRFLFCKFVLVLLLVPWTCAKAMDPDIKAARAAAGTQKWDVAIEKARAVLGRAPESLEALQILGEAQIAVGDTLEGMEYLKRALSIKADDVASLVPLVNVCLIRGAVNDADYFVSKAEAKDRRGRLWEIKACRARILAEKGQVAEAMKILAEATANNPTNPLYPKTLARLYRDRNIFELAVDQYRQAIELAPEDLQLRFELANVLLKNKQFSEAMSEFQTVREADPMNPEVNYQVGKLYFAAGRYRDALEPLQAATRDRPNHFISNYLLGQTYLKLAQLAGAEESLRKALKLRPQHREVQLLLAKTLAEKKKYAEEITLLSSVLSDTTSDAEMLSMEGDAYYNLAALDSDDELKSLHYDSAAVFFKRSLAAAPGQPDITYRVATIYYNHDQLDSAVVYYQKTLDLQPGKCGAVINMGYSYGRLKKWSEAIKTLRRGIVCDRSNIPARSYLASILAARDSLEAAIDIYKEVVALDSANCEAHGQMGLIHFNREQHVSAIRNLRQAVTYCPDRGDFWSLFGYANWSLFLKIREQIRDRHDGLIPGDELWAEGKNYLDAAERGFGKALRYNPNDKDLKETSRAVTNYKKRLSGD